jgi:hypothetical protein
MERKQGSSAMMQNGGGSLTPPPGTGGMSNGGRTPSECSGARSQSLDVSEGERKREGWESVAVRVCCFWASTGGFYRHGRVRELGFPVVAEAVSGDVHGQSWARRPWERAGRVWSWCRGTVGRRWRDHTGRHRAESRGKERGVRTVSSLSSMSHGPGRGRAGWGSTEGESTAWLQG